MKTLSAEKLAETVKRLREEKELTKIELGNLTGINRILVGRIENDDSTQTTSYLKKKILK